MPIACWALVVAYLLLAAVALVDAFTAPISDDLD
jgi:hypothetical protein